MRYKGFARATRAVRSIIILTTLLALALPFAASPSAVRTASAKIDIPAYNGWVTDQTGTLNATEIQTLGIKLEQFKRETSNEIAVLLVPTVEPYTIEEYSIAVARDWGVGRKGINNGVLFIIAINDRQMRFEIGTGLEGAIPDITAKQIIDDIARPHFRNGDFFIGIDESLTAIMQAAKGEYNTPVQVADTTTNGNSGDFMYILVLYAVSVSVIQMVVTYMRNTKSWWQGGVLGGIIGGVMALIFFGTAIIGIAIFVAIFGGLGALFDWYLSKDAGKPGAKNKSHSAFWLFFNGGRDNDRWGGGSSGGGFSGFSGGGFSGGGSSGSW